MADTPGAEPLPALAWGPVFEQHPLPHYVYDPDGLRMLAANRAALQRFGYTLPEFLALSPADLLDPAELPAMRAYLAGVKTAGGGTAHRLWRERTRDGRILHADVQGMPVTFEGRPARLVAVVDAGVKTRLAADAEQARDLVFKAGSMAQLGGWAFDIGAGRVHMSDVVCALHEIEPGSEIGLERALEFYPAQASAALREAVLQCRTEGTPFDLELPFVGARGTERWVRVVGEAVRDASGRIVHVEGAQQDITDRKRAAMELDRSRHRFAALLAAIPDLWIVLDAEHRYVQVSDPHHPALSTPWAQRLGRRMSDILPPALAPTLEGLMAQVHRTGQSQTHHYELVVQSGALRSFEARYVALDEGHTMALVRDVTEMLMLERRFQAMAQAAPIGIFMTDASGGCTYTNAAWQRLFGMTLAQSLGDGWAGSLHPDDRQRVHEGWMAAVRAVQPFEMEFRVLDAGGTVRRVAVRSSPVVLADGGLSGHVGTVVDLTQQRELEAARQAQAVAEEAGQRQAAFMSRVSHELRTPLNAILGFGQLLQHNPDLADTRAQAHVGHVVQAGRHMLALVDDLLELQRLQQGDIQPKLTRLDAGALLEVCADMLQPMAQAAGVSIERAPAAIELLSDERCVRQILLNLGSNAVKYAGRGARVVLSAGVSGDAVRLSVTDSGKGMTAEQMQRLFNPFERLGQDALGVPGSGLGLVITRQLAHLLGGEVLLRSSPGQGTVATLELPRQPGQARVEQDEG